MKVVQHKIYLPRPIYVNRNNDENHANKDITNNVRDGIEGGKYLLLAFLLIILILTLTRLIYKLFKNENR
jgi:hypothetical protein|nr:MAG TPA: hypothetical protein [Caudoviricetes sp.]